MSGELPVGEAIAFLALYAIPTAMRVRKENSKRMPLIKDYEDKEVRSDLCAWTTSMGIVQGAVYGISLCVGSSLIAIPITTNVISYICEKAKPTYDDLNKQLAEKQAMKKELEKMLEQ